MFYGLLLLSWIIEFITKIVVNLHLILQLNNSILKTYYSRKNSNTHTHRQKTEQEQQQGSNKYRKLFCRILLCLHLMRIIVLRNRLRLGPADVMYIMFIHIHSWFFVCFGCFGNGETMFKTWADAKQFPPKKVALNKSTCII